MILCFQPTFSNNYLSSDRVLLAAFEKLFISFEFLLAEACKLRKSEVVENALENEGVRVKAEA